jgi:hypothetical protein
MVAPPANVIGAYTRQFQQRFADQPAASALGVWLLAALVAPATAGVQRRDLEDALGLDADSAAATAAALLEHPHPAVAGAVAVWGFDAMLNESYRRWVSTLPDVAERGPVPTQDEADRWVERASAGMIRRFPIRFAADTALVLVSALATDVRWVRPYTVVDAAGLGGAFAGRVGRCLETFDVRILRTESAGLVAAHWNRSSNDLEVCSVIAGEHVAPADVHAAALELLAARTAGTVAQHGVDFDELEPGEGPAWKIAVEDGYRDVVHAVVPAWRADEDPFAVVAAPGMAAVLATAETMFAAHVTGLEAVQKVFAEYDATGFRAAAISAISYRSAAVPTLRQVRRVEVRYNRPYAVLASTVVDGSGGGAPDDTVAPFGLWHGVPVFSAWVRDPVEPDSNPAR